VGLRVAQHNAEGVDGIALEAESDVGVDGGHDADVGVVEEFLIATSSTPWSGGGRRLIACPA
jgi:hypothetical protein